MKVNEIPEKTTVNISVTTESGTLNVTSTIEELTEYEKKSLSKLLNFKDVYFAVVSLITQGGKNLGFAPGKEYTYSLGCSVKDKYYNWNNVLIKTIKILNGKICYVVLSPLDVSPTNRRNAYRLWIGEEISLTLGLGKDNKRGILKDLSATGMGIIVSDASEFQTEKIVHVLYIDNNNTNFNLTGKIVNITELSPGKILIGCKFLNKSDAINKYVSQKQIENAKNRRK